MATSSESKRHHSRNDLFLLVETESGLELLRIADSESGTPEGETQSQRVHRAGRTPKILKGNLRTAKRGLFSPYAFLLENIGGIESHKGRFERRLHFCKRHKNKSIGENRPLFLPKDSGPGFPTRIARDAPKRFNKDLQGERLSSAQPAFLKNLLCLHDVPQQCATKNRYENWRLGIT